MSDPILGLTMLGLIVIAIMMGFPTAFTLMGLGMFFGFMAYFDPAHGWLDNKIFDLMVERTYGVMTNDTLLSVPLFVLMGYVIERAALVDRMFHSVQLAFRRVPASLAVATLLVCTFWGIASGIVGAVVVLMGVIALRPMLKAGYDIRLASGVITAGGTLGILIPPSVMIIVYAAVTGQSVVKLYAAAMFPGFFLSLLYLVYIVGWAMINPKVAPPLPASESTVAVPPWLGRLQEVYSRNTPLAVVLAAIYPSRLARSKRDGQSPVAYSLLLRYCASALFPLVSAAVIFAGTWWYVVIYQPASQLEAPAAAAPVAPETSALPANPGTTDAVVAGQADPRRADGALELSGDQSTADVPPESAAPNTAQQLSDEPAAGNEITGPPAEFFTYFWMSAATALLLLAAFYWWLTAEQFEIMRMLIESVMPLGILTFLVLAVILFGITTATESAAVGVAGALLLAWLSGQLTLDRVRQSMFLTARTTAMVCWLFIGSALFSAVFALHGGQQLIEKWVMGMSLSPLQFMLLSQAIIFFLGWPLEWTEIIVIFVPIFVPLLPHFHIDPVLFGTLVAVNLQAAFLSPPVAMSAFYLKGVSPPHVTLNQIFAGMMPYMMIIIVCMAIMYIWPGMTLWLPNYLYK